MILKDPVCYVSCFTNLYSERVYYVNPPKWLPFFFNYSYLRWAHSSFFHFCLHCRSIRIHCMSIALFSKRNWGSVGHSWGITFAGTTPLPVTKRSLLLFYVDFRNRFRKHGLYLCVLVITFNDMPPQEVAYNLCCWPAKMLNVMPPFLINTQKITT